MYSLDANARQCVFKQKEPVTAFIKSFVSTAEP